MDEQFDEKLKSRITEVFDNYEFPPADEAWLELRKKFPVKEERKVAWLWWSSAAAILLVFLGIGLWLINKPNAPANVAVNPKTIQPTNAVPGSNKPDSLKQPQVTDANAIAVSPAQKPAGGSKTNGRASGFTKTIRPAPAYTAGNNKPVNKQPVTNPVPLPAYTAVVNKPVNKQQQPAGNPIPAISDAKTSGNIAQQKQNTPVVNGKTPNSTPNAVIDAQPTQPQIARVDAPANTSNNSINNPAANSGKTSPVITKQPAKTIEDLLNEGKTQQVAQQKNEKKELKKVNFSVYAATYINYAEGSANQVNAGAGFTSDIRLGKKVKLSTGVSLAQNTLSYAGTAPVNNNNRAMAAAAPSIVQDGLFSPVASVAELKSSNASLVGLDIPINIKYEFNPEKSDTYISAGLSSGTFIDERYTYRYSYRNNSAGYSSTAAVSTQDQTSTQSFNSFYFGKTLNLSFGTGFPIGKTNRLVIEPFLKYPLGGLGAQAIHFGAGGVNLKLNFKSGKK
jgi:hypothetical protein